MSELELGPNNTVFAPLSISAEPVVSYNGEVVFAAPALKATAEFPGRSLPSMELGPADGERLVPWLGEIAIVPEGFRDTEVVGRTVEVHFTPGSSARFPGCRRTGSS